MLCINFAGLHTFVPLVPHIHRTVGPLRLLVVDSAPGPLHAEDVVDSLLQCIPQSLVGLV